MNKTVSWFNYTEVTHDCESEFITSAKLYNFQEELTEFVDIGGTQTTTNKAKRRKGGGGTGGSNKLVDVTQLRAKFSVKLSTVTKTALTHLKEATAMYEAYAIAEKELIDRFRSFLFAIECFSRSHLLSCKVK